MLPALQNAYALQPASTGQRPASGDDWGAHGTFAAEIARLENVGDRPGNAQRDFPGEPDQADPTDATSESEDGAQAMGATLADKEQSGGVDHLAGRPPEGQATLVPTPSGEGEPFGESAPSHPVSSFITGEPPRRVRGFDGIPAPDVAPGQQTVERWKGEPASISPVTSHPLAPSVPAQGTHTPLSPVADAAGLTLVRQGTVQTPADATAWPSGLVRQSAGARSGPVLPETAALRDGTVSTWSALASLPTSGSVDAEPVSTADLTVGRDVMATGLLNSDSAKTALPQSAGQSALHTLQDTGPQAMSAAAPGTESTVPGVDDSGLMLAARPGRAAVTGGQNSDQIPVATPAVATQPQPATVPLEAVDGLVLEKTLRPDHSQDPLIGQGSTDHRAVTGAPSAPTPGQNPALPGSPVDTARSVAMQIASGMPGEGRGFELALHPEELGRVRIALSATDAGNTLLIHADRPETLDLMRRHVAQLEQELRNLGFENLSLQFTLSDRQQQQERHIDGHHNPVPDADPIDSTMLSGSLSRQTLALGVSTDRLDIRL